MRIDEIHIRDPYILMYDDTYYMYGTSFFQQNGFLVYKSKDLAGWSDAEVVFAESKDFWADRDFWAPEVHIYKDKFYMLASFKSATRKRGTQILVADSPCGKFEPISEFPVTPDNWECLDGTLYIDRYGRPHIVFCHEWVDGGEGTVCEFELTDDLKSAVYKPRFLWKATDFIGVKDALKDRKSLVTDGPYLWRLEDGELICIWSSFGDNGYVELIARSSNGDIDGKWTVDDKPLSNENGGHGMIFKSKENRTLFVMHYPNTSGLERAVIKEVYEIGKNIEIN